MKPREAICATLDALDAAELPHMLTGGLVTNLYGISRSTKDADIVIEMEPRRFDDFARRLPPDLVLDAQVTFETITGSRRHIITIERSPFRIELFMLGADAHHRERFARRRRAFLTELGRESWVSSAEDLVIQKLRWKRDKDREDLKNIIGVQGDALDWPRIHRWCEIHGTRTLLDEIRASIPPLD